MTTHIYAFGSICRGEYSYNSDVDLLVCASKSGSEVFDTDKFSVYDHARIVELWNEGNPFAWHLHLESRLIYSSDGVDFIRSLGAPSPYVFAKQDCLKFKMLFDDAMSSLINENTSQTFHVSCIFLAVRNIATCYSLYKSNPIFSRSAPYLITPVLSLDKSIYNIMLNARVLSTRGVGERLSKADIETVKTSTHVIKLWIEHIMEVVCDE